MIWTDEFNAKVDDLEECVKDVRNDIASLGPISTDPIAVEKQLQLVQVSVHASIYGSLQSRP